MFELSVQTEFSAAHALLIRGVREPVHGHNWHVTVTLAGRTLDPDGLLVDFHAVQRCLAEIVAPWKDRDLNAARAFERVNPSAENVARHIGDELARRLEGIAPPEVQVRAVRVTEATGCAATYRPSSHAPPPPPPAHPSPHP